MELRTQTGTKVVYIYIYIVQTNKNKFDILHMVYLAKSTSFFPTKRNKGWWLVPSQMILPKCLIIWADFEYFKT